MLILGDTMWKVMAIIFTVTFAITPLVTEVLRRVIHVRRQRRDGLGGTQDIAMYGAFAAFASAIVAAICWWFAFSWIAPAEL